MEEHKTTKTTTLEKALEEWTKEFNSSMSTHSQNQKDALILYQKKYKELEAHYASRLQNALKHWRESYIKNRNTSAREKFEKELADLTQEYTKKSNKIIHDYNQKLKKHQDANQAEIKKHKEHEAQLILVKSTYDEWLKNYN